jgi:hypothetical protein
MFWLNYLDRNAIAVARLNHLEKDLGLVGTRKCAATSLKCRELTATLEYQTCISILFVGYVHALHCMRLVCSSNVHISYILGGVPSNMLITRVRPSYYLVGFADSRYSFNIMTVFRVV